MPKNNAMTPLHTIGYRNGRAVWLDQDGGILTYRNAVPVPVVRGGDGSEGEGGEGEDDDQGGGEGEGGKPKTEGKLTEAEINRRIKDRVGETKKSTEAAIAKQLGVTVAEAARIIADHKTREDAEKSEAQLARDKADKEAADSESAKSEAAREKHEARIERALIRAGVPLPDDGDEKAEARVARIVGLVDIEVGAEGDDIKTAVATLKDEMPELFGGAEDAGGDGTNGDGKPKGTPNSDPKKPKSAGGKPAEDAFARGRDRAKTTAGRSRYSFEKDKVIPDL